MSTAPFGAPGFGIPSFDPSQWFAGFAQAAPPQPVNPFAWLRTGQAAPAASVDPSALATQWMTQIQQLAAQFAGREAAPADIVRTWRGMLGENPFASTMAASAFMPPPLFGGAGGGLGLEMPAFGYMREHQERLQDFARAGVEFQHASQAFQSIVAEAGKDAFSRFESLLAQRTGDGKPLESSRALFDLWIDAAEDAYADIALSERFQKAFGEYVNAQMRVRAAMQKEVELASAQWGIPGREEVDGAHRRIAELQRELRRLRKQVESLAKTPSTKAATPVAEKPAAAPAAKSAAKAAAKKTTGKR